MKSNASKALLISFLLASGAAASAESSQVFPYDVKTETLGNGLRIILIPMSSAQLVSYWTIVRTGARDEYEPNRTGFAHFFEHMMYRGTEKYPAEKYNEIMTSIGADVNAYTSDDLTTYYVSAAATELSQVMELESDRFQNLSYPKQMFETEAGAVYGEYRKNRVNPFFILREALGKEAFKKHTYGHMPIGTEEDIQIMPGLFDYSKSFFSRYYRPENIILLIAGGIDVDPTLEMIRRHYGGWEPGYRAPEITLEPEQTAERRVDINYEGRSLPMVWIGYKGPAFDPTDRMYVAIQLFCDLAFGQTSDLYRKLVIEEQVVDLISANQQINRDPGLIDIVVRVKDPAKVDYVLSEIDRVLTDFQTTAPRPERLRNLQSRLKYQFLMTLDTPVNVAQALVRYVAVSGSYQVVNEFYATTDKVSTGDVLEATRTFFKKERRTIVFLKGAEG